MLHLGSYSFVSMFYQLPVASLLVGGEALPDRAPIFVTRFWACFPFTAYIIDICGLCEHVIIYLCR